MNEMIYEKAYEEYKEELRAEFNRAAESFVKIGYLLKVARDTDILQQSEYNNVVDFAKAEYGIDKTQVSRFIRINDKFSEGGYADHLLPEYQGYGYAKLTLMLQLPDAVNEGLSPQYSKTEIQAIKEEIDEESKTSDIEIMLEQTAAVGEQSNIDRVILQLGEDEPDLYVAMHGIFARGEGIQKVKEQMAPAGVKTYTVRVKGQGRMMLMLNDETEDARIINTRSGEKISCTWDDILASWQKIMQTDADPKAIWEKLYYRQFPQEEKAPVAPVQQSRKESKVTRAKTKPTKPKTKPAPKPINTECGQQSAAIVENNKNEENVTGNEQIVPENEEIATEDKEIATDVPEKLTGEVVEKAVFTEKHRQLKMYKDDIRKDIKRISEQVEMEMWQGMQLTLADINETLQLIIKFVTDKEEDEDE